MADVFNLGDLTDRGRDCEKIALIDLGVGGARSFSYSQIDAMAQGVARGLLAMGLRRGERVAILSRNCAEYLATVFGVMRAGLVAVPVNFKFPPETIAFIIADAGARVIFCDPPRRASCPAGMPVISFGDPPTGDFKTFLIDGGFPSVIPEAHEPAMFLYTSGSTGTPKGVVLSHQSHLWVTQTRLAGQDLSRHVYLIAAPMFHMNALSLSQLVFAAHASMVLLPQFTARAYIDAIAAFGCTWLTAVPPMIAMMLRESEHLAAADLSSVEFVRMGSAPVSESLLAGLRRALPRAAITNAYGTTEAGPVVFGPHPEGLRQPDMSVGYRHPKVSLRLVGDAGEQATHGELQMKCPALMNGYHNRPDRVAFTPDGFYATGDVFRRDENGFHFFVGRVDDMFVSGGENIFPGDVEQMLEKHPAVAQACVVPVDDDIKGQKPVAFVVLREGFHASADEIRQFALRHAPAYQHPRFVWFVERLPLASTNKVDRTLLKAEAANAAATDPRGPAPP